MTTLQKLFLFIINFKVDNSKIKVEMSFTIKEPPILLMIKRIKNKYIDLENLLINKLIFIILFIQNLNLNLYFCYRFKL